MVNANLESYKITGSRETPEIDVGSSRATSAKVPPTRRESARPPASSRSEPPSATPSTTPSACAFARLPMTPAVVLAALNQPVPGRSLA